MKKLLVIAFGIGMIASLQSCKKDYTCTCTYTSAGQTATYEWEILDAKKSDAEDACKAYVGTVGVTYSCELK